MSTQAKPRQARASRSAAQAEPQPEPQVQPEPQAQPKPKPEPKPDVVTASLDLGVYMLPQYKPVVTGADGAEHRCEHHYGHGDERAARKCAGSLAAQAGLVLPAK